MWSRAFLGFTLLALAGGCRQAAHVASAEPDPSKAGGSRDRVAVLEWSVDEGPRVGGPGVAQGAARTLILGGWADGEIVWSGDSVRGGPPYWRARIDPAEVSGVLSQICETLAGAPFESS